MDMTAAARDTIVSALKLGHCVAQHASAKLSEGVSRRPEFLAVRHANCTGGGEAEVGIIAAAINEASCCIRCGALWVKQELIAS